MKGLCGLCNLDYEEKNEDVFIFIISGCPLICYECIEKNREEFNKRYKEDGVFGPLSKNV